MPDPYPAVELRLAQAITTRCLGHWWTAALRFVTGIGHRQTDEIVEAREYRWSSAGWATGPIIGVKISPISGAGPRVVPAFEKSARQPTLQAWRLAPRGAFRGRSPRFPVCASEPPKGNATAAHARRKSAGSTPACLSIARSVPSGMSPGWFGTVVYRSVRGLNQISWLPAAWRSNSKPHTLSFRTISRYRNPASRPIHAATTMV